jgi:hypothetical protein
MPRLKPKTDGQSQEVIENDFQKFGQAPDLPLDTKVENYEVSQSRQGKHRWAEDIAVSHYQINLLDGLKLKKTKKSFRNSLGVVNFKET